MQAPPAAPEDSPEQVAPVLLGTVHDKSEIKEPVLPTAVRAGRAPAISTYSTTSLLVAGGLIGALVVLLVIVTAARKHRRSPQSSSSTTLLVQYEPTVHYRPTLHFRVWRTAIFSVVLLSLIASGYMTRDLIQENHHESTVASISSVRQIAPGNGIQNDLFIRNQEASIQDHQRPLSNSLHPRQQPEIAQANEAFNPTSLRIPSLGVDARVFPVGLDSDKAVDVPTDIRLVGWYQDAGLVGGSKGSTVLVGHKDGSQGDHGVFYSLHELEIGDSVSIENETGKHLFFTVASRETFNNEDFGQRAPHWFAVDGPPRLTLITCGGPYESNRGGYQALTVVTAQPQHSGSKSGEQMTDADQEWMQRGIKL